MLNKILNKNKEAVKIFWNEDLFKGMTRSEIVKFKEKNRKLVVKYYTLTIKCQKAERELFEARDKFLASKNIAAKSSNNLKLRLTVGGLALATVCTVGAMKSNAVTSTEANATVKTVELTEVESLATIDELVAEVSSNVSVEDNLNVSVEEAVAEEITEVISETTFDTEVSNDIVYSNIESIESSASNDVLILDDIIEEDFITFDKALEMLDARCNENYSGAVFNGLSDSTLVPLMGTYILPHYEDSAGRKVAEWFEAFFGSEVTTHSLRYDSSFKIKAGGAKFESLEGGFTVTIDTSAIDVLVNLNLQDSIDASIRGGVSQEIRDALTSEKYLEFMPSLDKMFELQHESIKQSLVGSESLLGNVKFSIEKELKDLTGWDVTVVFN